MQKVDLEYQHIANITPIKNIVICKNKESTEYFLENVYQHFIDCIVVSADKTYPLNPSLNSKVFDALENDNTLNLIVINFPNNLTILENQQKESFQKHVASHKSHAEQPGLLFYD